METRNEELREFLEDLKLRNDRIYETDFANQLSAARLLREVED